MPSWRTLGRVRRIGIVLGKAGVYLAVFLVVAALNAVLATAWIGPDVAAFVGTLVWTGSLLVIYLVIYAFDLWPAYGKGLIWLGIAWFFSAFLMFAVAVSFWAFVLDQRGQQVVANVVEVHSNRGISFIYILDDHDGLRIPGRLMTWPGNDALFTEKARGAIGDQVIVIRDPEGLVDPRLPEELADARETAGLLPLIVAVLAGLCVGAAWQPREELPQTPEELLAVIRLQLEGKQPGEHM